jgi:membrane carboxypeptidase/penicillin-binding protein
MTGRLALKTDWDLVRSTLFYEWQQFKRQPDIVPPLIVQRLLISGEDHRHARHLGYDLYAICRAIWRRVSSRSREGASTIEQQLVRVITNRYENTFLRKACEIVLASLVSESFPKKILPIIYLRLGYFGWRMNGYSQACKRLRLSNENLTLRNAAGLVARLKYPEPKLAPPLRMFQIERRTNHLLMLHQKHLFDGTYEYDNSKAFRSRYSFKRLVRTIS